MNISIVSKRVDLTDDLKLHIEKALASLDKFHLDILSAKVIVSDADKHGKKGFDVEFIVALAGRDTVVVKQHDKDLDAGIDLGIDRVQKVLRRQHDKSTDKRHVLKPVIPDLVHDDTEDDIIPAELDLPKPVEIEEALEHFKHSGAMFIIFKDTEGLTRVMYRRKDGKIGLY